jgi:phosphoglycolate phosphatase-like HAD superfamily hydrolase
MSDRDGRAAHRKPKVVIFDFDGTIADTMPYLVDLAARLLRTRYGMTDAQARQAYVETTGLPFCRQIEIIAPGNGLNQATVEEFEADKVRHLKDFRFFADALPVLVALRSQGFKVCLSSGNYEGLIRDVLRSRGLVVDLVMGYRPGFEKGPQHFDEAARTFGVALDDVLFVGDSVRDGLAAGQAGVRFIARLGLVSRQEIGERLPDVPVVDSLYDVLPILGMKKPREDEGNPLPT